MKRLTIRNTGRSLSGRNFYAAANQVIEVVASFGEELCAKITGGEVVSTDQDYASFADVFVEDHSLAVQVKMCNHRHAHRPTISQVVTLHEQVKEVSFLVNVMHGVYALVFYGGVGLGGINRGKSKILSRKLGREGKKVVIGRELQYIYFIDVELMNYLATEKAYEHLRKSGKVKVCAERKLYSKIDKTVLYLNRTFLQGFVGQPVQQTYRDMLDASLGSGDWRIRKEKINLRFTTSVGLVRKALPIIMVGSREVVKSLRKMVRKADGIKIPLANGNQPHL
ncbi:MAG: hypothetical protein PHF79_00450 [Candidatus Pacebacteria bacterium]|nr:hypothetical protein [Candidatus Paceibacterota bacterium]